MQLIFDMFINILTTLCNNEIFVYIVVIFMILGIFGFLFNLGRF